MATDTTPRVYVDTCVFLNVLKREPGLWRTSLQVLTAAERGDIRLVASRLLPAEVGNYRGDKPKQEVDEFVVRYLDDVRAEWVEVDLIVEREARRLAWAYKIDSGADSIHLATALRRKCRYFMSRDHTFPYGATIEGTRICEPDIVWSPTIEDFQIDHDADEEEAQLAAEELAKTEAEIARQAEIAAAKQRPKVTRPRPPSTSRPPASQSPPTR